MTTLAGAMIAVAAAGIGPRAVRAAGPSLTQTLQLSYSVSVTCTDGREFPQAFSSPAVGDLLGDGHKQIVFALPNGDVHVVDAITGKDAPGWPQNVGDDVASSPTVATLDGDATPSVVVSSYSGYVHVWDRNGRERAGWPQSTISHGGSLEPGFFSSVAVGDVFADGHRELFASGLDQHTYAWRSDGSALPGWPKLVSDSALATPALGDLTHSGTMSIVTPSDASGVHGVHGGIYWAWGADGSPLWWHGVDEVPWASPAIAAFGDGNQVIVNGTGHFYAQTTGGTQGRYVTGLNSDGKDRPGFPSPTGYVSFASPAIGDLYGDGGREIIETDESQTVYGLRGDGSALPGFPFRASDGPNFSAGAAIAPVDASGRNGLYIPTRAGLAVYAMESLANPTVVQVPNSVFSTPAVADLGGGHLSAIVQSGDGACNSAGSQTITVFSVGGTTPAMLGASAWPTFHGNMQRTGNNPAPPPPAAHGYWLVASDGGIFPFGNATAHSYGSTGGIHLNRPIVGIAGCPGDTGYYLVASDGGIFPFGTAQQHAYGSTGGMTLNQPIAAMALTASGNGYWLVATDGGIFPFGDAGGYGSTGGMHLNQPIVGMAPTPTGRGYWLVATDGGIFPFGDATGYGSTGGSHLNQPIVGMAATPGGHGYWLVARDGGIFPFGDAAGYGSTGGIHLNQPILGMARSFDGRGYYLVAADGGIFPFGDAHGYGSTGGIHLNQPIVGMATTQVTTSGF